MRIAPGNQARIGRPLSPFAHTGPPNRRLIGPGPITDRSREEETGRGGGDRPREGGQRVLKQLLIRSPENAKRPRHSSAAASSRLVSRTTTTLARVPHPCQSGASSDPLSICSGCGGPAPRTWMKRPARPGPSGMPLAWSFEIDGNALGLQPAPGDLSLDPRRRREDRHEVFSDTPVCRVCTPQVTWLEDVHLRCPVTHRCELAVPVACLGIG
jgi:hypothetical protein